MQLVTGCKDVCWNSNSVYQSGPRSVGGVHINFNKCLHGNTVWLYSAHKMLPVTSVREVSS